MAKKKQEKKSSREVYVAVLLTVFVLFIAFVYFWTTPPKPFSHIASPLSEQGTTFDFGNHMYTIDDKEVSFVQGLVVNKDTLSSHQAQVSEKRVSPSQNRAAAILIDQPGGSGTFYYLVAAMKKDGKETFSAPVLLGDRIKVASVIVDDPGMENNGVVTVKYLDRLESEPMSAQPSIEKVLKYAFQDDGNLLSVL